MIGKFDQEIRQRKKQYHDVGKEHGRTNEHSTNQYLKKEEGTGVTTIWMYREGPWQTKQILNKPREQGRRNGCGNKKEESSRIMAEQTHTPQTNT